MDDPDGIRTRVAALKGPCPRPLDDGAAAGKPTDAFTLHVRAVFSRLPRAGPERGEHYAKFRRGVNGSALTEVGLASKVRISRGELENAEENGDPNRRTDRW